MAFLHAPSVPSAPSCSKPLFSFSIYHLSFSFDPGLTKIRTYALISGVRHGATVKSRLRESAAASAGAEARRSRAQSENARRKMRMSRSYEGTSAAKEHKERRDKNFCRFLPCDPCVLLRPVHSWLRLRRAARFLSANLSAVLSTVGPAKAEALAAVERCGMENAKTAFLPYEPIHAKLYLISGLYHFCITTKASSEHFGAFWAFSLKSNTTAFP